MARIEYADPNTVRAGAAGLVERIEAERGEVLHLYAMLLHSPPFAKGWLDLLTAVRHHGLLDGALRELMIMRIAHLNHAPYEAEQHRPIALREGLSEAQVEGTAITDLTAVKDPSGRALYDQRQLAALHLCDAMTRHVHVPDETFAAIRATFDPRETVELTITIASYNMVSRVLEALQIDAGDSRGGWA